MSTMKCRSCNTPMILNRRESSASATTSWHQCPLCKQKRLTSDPATSIRSAAISSPTQKDDDSLYAVESDNAWSDPNHGNVYLLT